MRIEWKLNGRQYLGVAPDFNTPNSYEISLTVTVADASPAVLTGRRVSLMEELLPDLR